MAGSRARPSVPRPSARCEFVRTGRGKALAGLDGPGSPSVMPGRSHPRLDRLPGARRCDRANYGSRGLPGRAREKWVDPYRPGRQGHAGSAPPTPRAAWEVGGAQLRLVLIHAFPLAARRNGWPPLRALAARRNGWPGASHCRRTC
ncbi:hypothetical protein ZWY2020_045537 [Hordeum vulgare]|nr:hypothetical protein ZWY2020_045537 [Hordeum vulgare]